MNNTISKFAIVIAGIALVISGLAYSKGVKLTDIDTIVGAAPGNMVAEDYIPYVMYNGGYNSNKSISTADTISGATVESTGSITAVTSITAGIGLTVSTGDTNVANFVEGGAVTTFVASTTGVNNLSAANICDQSYIPLSLGNTTTAVINSPTVASLFADCLLANGDSKTVVLYNTETVSSTTFAETETSSTINFNTSSAAILASDGLVVRYVRTASNALKIFVTSLPY